MTDSLPFGRHRGKLLPDVPSDYLAWLLRAVKLSRGLRDAVAAELVGRGVAAPPPPALPAQGGGACCAGRRYRHRWMDDRRGRRQIRRECDGCGTGLGFAPQVEPFTTEADAAASDTAALDVLLKCEE